VPKRVPKNNHTSSLTFLILFNPRCQRGFLKGIQLGQNIARNIALSENVFMMAICTELRIPLFVVGKPGSSKSLAKDVLSTNMKAGNSQSELFRNLKQVRD
jgi:hypothetical protein